MALNLLTLDEETAADLLWSARFPSGVSCLCGSKKVYTMSNGVFRCGGCRRDFSPLSGTFAASMKVSRKVLVAAALAFSMAKKGISSCELARVVGIQQKSAWVILDKFRRCIWQAYRDEILSGVVEIDGAFFGGHIRHMNSVVAGRTKRTGRWHYGNRRVVVVCRQRLGKTLVHVCKRESEAREFIFARVAEGSVIQTDQAHAWDSLSELYSMLRINHKWSFSSNGVHTNGAESFFASMRRAQNGTYHKISGNNLHLYAQEVAWRLDCKGMKPEAIVRDLLAKLCVKVIKCDANGVESDASSAMMLEAA